MKRKYLIEYRVVTTRVKEVESDSVALAEEKLYETEKDYIDEIMGIVEKDKAIILKHDWKESEEK